MAKSKAKVEKKEEQVVKEEKQEVDYLHRIKAIEIRVLSVENALNKRIDNLVEAISKSKSLKGL